MVENQLPHPSTTRIDANKILAYFGQMQDPRLDSQDAHNPIKSGLTNSCGDNFHFYYQSIWLSLWFDNRASQLRPHTDHHANPKAFLYPLKSAKDNALWTQRHNDEFLYDMKIENDIEEQNYWFSQDPRVIWLLAKLKNINPEKKAVTLGIVFSGAGFTIVAVSFLLPQFITNGPNTDAIGVRHHEK
mgnify:CR=1 FL=1